MAGADEFGQSEAGDSRSLTIDGRYVINPDHKLPDFVNCPSYQVKDTVSPTTELLALAPSALLPPQASAAVIAKIRVPNLLPVRSFNDATGSLWILCDAPPGNPLSDGGTWTETAVLERVIVPIASILHAYNEAGVTHRAIRPDNVFDAGGRSAVCLGPAVTAPPAYFQPDRFEPLTSALCEPAGRGSGSIVDDIFSLGALAAWLLGGCAPYRDDAPGGLLEERFQKGSFAVLAGHLLLSQDVAPLLAAMLSDDPAARPSPRDLLHAADHKGYVVRRSTAATAPIMLGSVRIKTARALAWYAARYGKEFASLLVRGVIERWMSYELGMPQAAGRLALLARDAALAEDGTLASSGTLMEIISAIDPTMPLCWNGIWFWPDAIGQLLTSALAGKSTTSLDPSTAVFELIRTGRLDRFALVTTVATQAAACAVVQKAARQVSVETLSDIDRLPYALNPYLPCLSPRCESDRLTATWALLQWLNAGQDTETAGATALLDRQMTTFMSVAALRSRLVDAFSDLAITKNSWPLDLALLARLQHLYMTGPLKGIGRKLLPHLTPELKRWRSRSTRTSRGEQLAVASGEGDLGLMQKILTDPQALRRDQTAYSAARKQEHALKAERERLERQDTDVPLPMRNEMIRLATAVGVVCAIGSLCAEIVL
ncbi:hypothetical protein [Acetobacter sp.]|jgi:hypothetical protein|uniref:hypothetical protein n=1 Tax=Acetobacter sp. TaxID=440 RepID=UPI0025BED72E|nr:hypothetical protein [Acetobacter sp.]MCH4091541.1 hypothetical protein [Acetobacter sp.]MCI1299519.1 hypothetical protein [Acetobacter sp.]MCI1316891.1 hypothetical protein [Acetobacter sp.]